MNDRAPLVGGPSAPAELLLRDVRVLDPRTGIDTRADLLVSEGRIASIAEPGTIADDAEQSHDPGRETIDGQGRLLALPAFFDPHVHLRTPGQEHKEDLDSGTRAAAAGGYAGVIAMPNTDPVIDSAPLLRSLRDAAAREARIPVGFLPAITRGLEGEQLTEMGELAREGALGFTDDGRPVASAGMLRKALQYQRLSGGVLALHEEDKSLSRGGAMNEGALSTALGIAGIPTVAESTMVARDAALAGYEDGRVHFQHLSCAESVAALASAKQRGWRLSGEVSPHHLLLTEEDVRGLDTRMKMHPPLTTEQDRQALIEALREGTIDCVATDHAPHAREEKEVPFEQAPMGTTGLETAFAALYGGLVEPGILDLATLVIRLTAGAELFGLPPARIAPEEPANLMLVDLDTTWIAGEHGWESRSENCCFAGRRMRGRVLMTIAAGGIAHRDARCGAMGGGADGAALAQPAMLIVVDVQEGFRSYETFDGVARAAPSSWRRPASWGCRRLSASSTRKASATRRPRSACTASRSRRRSSRPSVLTASDSRAATRRSSAGSRRMSVSARPSTTCSSAASRFTSPPTPSARATSWTTRAASSGSTARGPS